METVGRNDHAAGERSGKKRAEGGGGTIGAEIRAQERIDIDRSVDGFGSVPTKQHQEQKIRSRSKQDQEQKLLQELRSSFYHCYW